METQLTASDTSTLLTPISQKPPKKYYSRVALTIQESETFVQQSFELVGKDESGCLRKKPKTSEAVVRRCE